MQVPRFSKSSSPKSKSSPASRKPSWRVVLGKVAWLRHTYERGADDPLKLLGSVSKGSQVGALGITQDGQYVQIVGDHVTPLNTREITKAIAAAPKDWSSSDDASGAAPPWQVARKDAPAPIVIVKKRRVAIMP